MQLSVQSIYYIDRPGFPGVENTICPGPTGCQWLIEPEPVTVIHNSVFALSNWLAEGLLVSPLLMMHSSTHLTNTDSPSSIVATSSTP